MENRLTEPTAMPGMILGGKTAWKSWTMKGFAVAYHWVNDVPSACITRANHMGTGKNTVVIQFGNGLFQFADGKFLVEKAKQYASAMGLDDTWPTIYALSEVIMKAIDDLVYMPPAPPGVAPELGTMEVRANGKTIHEAAIH